MATSKPVITMSDKVRQELNSILADTQVVMAEATKQEHAGVPEMDAVVERCQDCITRIEAFKAVNFPNKK